jgi:C-terminal processing protease CtpA/Prc
MKRLALVLALVALVSESVSARFAQSSPVRLDTAAATPANLDFEEGEPGKAPPGWSASTTSSGFPGEISVEQPKSGKQCAVVRSEKPTGQFGILMQTIDAKPFRGHRVRYRAALRVSDLDTRAHLWLRVDRAGKRMGFFDNMSDRPVRSAFWETVEIVGDVDDDAESLNFGLLMQGSGRAFVDAASIEDLGKLVVVVEPARPLTERGLANVQAFARLLGYVRHFHPSDEAAAANWDAVAVEGVRSVEAASSSGDLARALESVFRSVAPTVRVVATGTKLGATTAPDGEISLVQWRHKGFGAGSGMQGVYASERARAPFANGAIPDGFHDPRAPLQVDLPGGVTAYVPLALFADARGTLPHREAAAKPASTPTLVKYSGDDRATRIADVALAWNVFRHFYPYFDVTGGHWSAELTSALEAAATDANAEAFTKTLRRMVAALRDGHGGVQGPEPSRSSALPILWAWVEGQLVVTASTPEAVLRPGDVVLEIDGRASKDVVEEAERSISSATPQWARYRALRDLRAGPDGSTVALQVRAADGDLAVTLKRSQAALALVEPRPEKIAELKPGVFYVDIDRIGDADFKAALPKLEKATGIVFDLRGYPNGLSPAPLQHLTDKPIESARWNVPIITEPDWRRPPAWNTDGRWALEPAAPRLKARIAFVTDGRAISYAESWMGIVEAYKLGAIVGETTAGTNGNVNPFTVPGGYTFYWTGMKVLKHDGSRHHGVGIAPTIPVSRTVRGVAEGRDEQLDRAVAIVSS